jgi:hypothetical protein
VVICDHIGLPVASAEDCDAGRGPAPELVAQWRAHIEALAR